MGQQGLRGGGTREIAGVLGQICDATSQRHLFTIQLMSVIISFLADLNHHVVINYP